MDAERRFVERLLTEIEQHLRLLEEARTREVFSDPLLLNGVYYTLQCAIEGVVAVAHHLIAAGGLEPPERNVDSVTTLFQAGVLSDPGLRECLPAMIRFRNLLVHRYRQVDRVRVRAILENDLGDFRLFATEIQLWLHAAG